MRLTRFREDENCGRPSGESDMRVVDLFCGGGGLSLGAHQAGFSVAVAIDNDPILASSYAYNFPDVKLVLEDVAKLDGESVQRGGGWASRRDRRRPTVPGIQCNR